VATTDGTKTELHVFDVVKRKFLHLIDLKPYVKEVDIYIEGWRIWSQDGNLLVVQGSGTIRKKHQKIKPRLQNSVMVFYVWDIAKGTVLNRLSLRVCLWMAAAITNVLVIMAPHCKNYCKNK
jgi:hypothetical protein